MMEEHVFDIGDYVYVSDWYYGQIIDISFDCALVEYETAGGGGSMWFEFDALTLAEGPVVYSSDENKNAIVSDLMNDWNCLVAKAKIYGMDIRLSVDGDSLNLYYHEDYPDLLLVDK